MKTFRFVSILLTAAYTLAACGAPATPPAVPNATSRPEPTTAAPRTFVLGAISENPEKKIAAYQPLADYLAAHLTQFGFTAGEVKVAPDQDTMVRWLKDGTVTLDFESPYSAMIENDQAGAQIILRRWKSGVGEYKSLLLVRKDSGITSLADLKGRVVAYDEPYSTTAYMLPTAYMIQAGLKVVEVPGADSAVPADKVGYVFAQGQENVTDWIATGKVSVGAFSDQDLKDVPADVMGQLVTLLETKPVPRFLVLAPPGMDQTLVDAIKTLLLGLDQTPEGPDILKTFEKTAKFDEVPNAQAMLASMRVMYEITKNK